MGFHTAKRIQITHTVYEKIRGGRKCACNDLVYIELGRVLFSDAHSKEFTNFIIMDLITEQ